MIKMLKNNVLVEKIEETERGGIILPETEIQSERCDLKQVKIVAVGPDVEIPIEPGDICLLAPMKGQEARIDGKKLYICKEVELFGKIEE